VTQERRLVGDFKAAYVRAATPYFKDHLDDIINVVLGVNAAWDWQLHQVYCRVLAEHECSEKSSGIPGSGHRTISREIGCTGLRNQGLKTSKPLA